MSLRQSFLTKRYNNVFYFEHGTHIHMYIRKILCIYIHTWCIWATVCQSQHEVKTIKAFIMNSDERGCQTSQKKSACEAVGAESSEVRETRLGKRRVADRAMYATNSDGRTERRRERRAADSSEQRETRLAGRRVAARARFSAIIVASGSDSS